MGFDMDAPRELSLDGDLFVQMHIPKKLQKFDPDLFSSKWFDYRRMTSLQATIQYVNAYSKICPEIYARDLDFERAKHIKFLTWDSLQEGLNENCSKAKRKLSGLWRGRQVADALGMPYEIYIERAFTFRMRHWSRAYLPQPEHLYHEFDVEKIQEYWEELQAGRLYLPEDPAYLVQNYKNIPYQNDLHEWIFKQASLRSNENQILADMINRDFLPIDKAANRLTEDAYRDVERYLQ